MRPISSCPVCSRRRFSVRVQAAPQLGDGAPLSLLQLKQARDGAAGARQTGKASGSKAPGLGNNQQRQQRQPAVQARPSTSKTPAKVNLHGHGLGTKSGAASATKAPGQKGVELNGGSSSAANSDTAATSSAGVEAGSRARGPSSGNDGSSNGKASAGSRESSTSAASAHVSADTSRSSRRSPISSNTSSSSSSSDASVRSVGSCGSHDGSGAASSSNSGGSRRFTGSGVTRTGRVDVGSRTGKGSTSQSWGQDNTRRITADQPSQHDVTVGKARHLQTATTFVSTAPDGRDTADTTSTTAASNSMEQQLNAARLHALRMLDRMPLSAWELETKLQERRGLDPALTAQVVQALTEQGLQSDAQVCEIWVRSRWNQQLKAPSIIRQELLQKHIAPHLIDEAIQAFFGGALRMKPAVLSLAHEMLGAGDLQLSSGGRHCEGAEDEPDLALAAQLVETAKRRLANMQPGISADAKRRRLTGWLQRRGHSWEVINTVVRMCVT